jgi:hypothetical protein
MITAAVMLPMVGWMLWGAMKLARLEQRIAAIEHQLDMIIKMLTRV